MRNGNVFRIKVISYEKLYYYFCNHNYKRNNEIPWVTLSELVQAQVSQAEDANLYEENGLFHQIEFVRNVEPTNNKKKPNVLDEIVFLDFKTIKKNFFKEHLEDIKYLFEKGFRVYSNNDHNNLVFDFTPFEKSASMGKDSKISFLSKIGYDGNKNIVENFYEKVIERSYLGLNEKVVKDVPLAKRYAYRGLLLSTGKRVTNIDIRMQGILPKFKFNKNTVLIVQDIKIPGAIGINYYTQEADKWNDNNTLYKFNEKTVEKTTDDDFVKCINDGYGFIGNELADSIDKFLSKDKSDNRHSSYQIRLPFVKGMVHRVNYQEFFKSIADEKGKIVIKSYDKDLEHKDIAYTLDELKDVQLIISASMFKAIKELRQFKAKHPEIGDALEYYFNKLNEYWHSLFILNMDKKNGEQEKETTWNYQYISTVELTDQEFEKLYDYSAELYKGIKTDPNKRIEYICSKDYDSSQEDEDEANNDNEQLNVIDSNYSLETKLLSLSIKDSMIREPYFKELLSKELDKMVDNFGVGRILLKGQDRFILGDPLKYLYFLTNNENKFKEELPDNSFYMPGIKQNEEIKEGNLYPVLRNPHLSRNEDLLLHIHFPDNSSERYKYLSNLTGTVIIDSTHSSIPAETLQGCDFDGDHAKIYFNDIYSNAILKNRVNGNTDGYPIVINDDYVKTANEQLNDGESKEEEFTDSWQKRYDVSIKTFSSSIGQISNLAFKESLLAYTTDCSNDNNIDIAKDKLRLLAILTGVEADSPKTGIKPEFQIVGKELNNIDFNVFINFKSKIKKSKTESDIKSDFNKDYKKKKNKQLSDDELNKECDRIYKGIYSNESMEDFVKTFMELSNDRKPSNVEKLIQRYYKLSKIRQKPVRQDINMLPWAKPCATDTYIDDETIFKADKYNSVLNLIIAYNRLLSEINYQAHIIENSGVYYKDLCVKAKWFDEENGESRLNSLINKLSNIQDVSYISFHSLYTHCTRQILVYKYYPYFSNPFNDYEESMKKAREWLHKEFNRYKISIEEVDYDLILSDAKFFYQLINNVKDRRYALYENVVSSETIKEIDELVKKEIFNDNELSKDEIEEYTNDFKAKLTKSVTDCNLKINHYINENYKCINTESDSIYDRYVVTLIRSVFNCECLQGDINIIINDSTKKFIENLNRRYSNNGKLLIHDEVCIKIVQILKEFLVRSLVNEWYGKEISVELIKLANVYRLAEASVIDKSQIEYYEYLKRFINQDTYWKSILKEKTIEKLRMIIDPYNKNSNDVVEEKMIAYVRACQNEGDQKQKFLMNVLGDIYYEVLARKVGNNND